MPKPMDAGGTSNPRPRPTTPTNSQVQLGEAFLAHAQNEKWGLKWSEVPEEEICTNDFWGSLATYIAEIYTIGEGKKNQGKNLSRKVGVQEWSGLLHQVKLRFNKSTSTCTQVCLAQHAHAHTAPSPLHAREACPCAHPDQVSSRVPAGLPQVLLGRRRRTVAVVQQPEGAPQQGDLSTSTRKRRDPGPVPGADLVPVHLRHRGGARQGQHQGGGVVKERYVEIGKPVPPRLGKGDTLFNTLVDNIRTSKLQIDAKAFAERFASDVPFVMATPEAARDGAEDSESGVGEAQHSMGDGQAAAHASSTGQQSSSESSTHASGSLSASGSPRKSRAKTAALEDPEASGSDDSGESWSGSGSGTPPQKRAKGAGPEASGTEGSTPDKPIALG